MDSITNTNGNLDSSADITATTPSFPALPIELRRMILQRALPPSQILTLDPIFHSIHQHREFLPAPRIPSSPITLFINKEYRCETLQKYCLVTVPITTISKEGTRCLSKDSSNTEQVQRDWLHYKCTTNCHILAHRKNPEMGDFEKRDLKVYFSPKRDVLDIHIRSITYYAHPRLNDPFSASPFVVELLSWSRSNSLPLSKIRNLQISCVDWSQLFCGVGESPEVQYAFGKKRVWLFETLALFEELRSVVFREDRNEILLASKGWGVLVEKAREMVGLWVEKMRGRGVVEIRFEDDLS